MKTLDQNSTEEEVASSVRYVTGMPKATHRALLASIVKETKRKQAQLLPAYNEAMRARAATKYSRLLLKTYLEKKGHKGRHKGNTLIIADPLVEGDEIIVRDSVLLGHKPIIEKASGYAPHINDYVAALVGGDDLTPFTISIAQIKQQAKVLSNCDLVADIPARLRTTPNIAAFEEALKRTNPRLLVALRMNTRFALVENGGQITIFNTETRDAYNRDEFKVKLQPEGDIIDDDYEPRQKAWFNHPARAYYEGVTFAPNGLDVHGRVRDLDRVFNLWTDIEQIGAPGDWSLLKAHIRAILCKDDEDAFEYLMNWMAHLFQKPWEKPGVAVVVWGKKRTGKGTVADAIREALGQRLSRMFTQKDHVVGKFSASAQPPLFNQIEEAVFAKNPREEGPLKSKITDPTETVELKFKTPYEVPSFGRWWFNSNSPTPVPITYDEERYFILHVSDERASDHAYFTAIRQQLYHDGGLAAMVHELMERDISKFNVRCPPHTAERAVMVLEMLSPADRAIADLLISGEVALLDVNKGAPIFTEQLLKHAATWIEKDKVRAALNDAFKRFGAKDASQADIAKGLRDVGVIDSERNAHAQRGQRAGYRFLPLEQAREKFAQARNLDIKMLRPTSDASVDQLHELSAAFDDALRKCSLGESHACYPELQKAAKIFREALAQPSTVH